jgi:putative redox protein
MTDAKPPVTAELVWSGDMRFGVTSGPNALVIDGNGDAGPSSTQVLLVALAGCMAIDVVTILRKGRHELRTLRATITGERAPEPPRRFVSVSLGFHIGGPVPAAAVDRAIALSRETYCSVWHSLRQDIELTITFDIHA